MSSDNSPLKPRARSELKRRYFHRGYLWPWILVLVIPFVLRFAMFYDVSFPFQSSPSTKEVVRLDELQLYKFSESSSDDVDRMIVRGSWVGRPGVGSKRTHRDGIDSSNDRMKNNPSHGSTEYEVSTARHIPVTRGRDDRDIVDVNLELSEENEEDVEGVVDEVQLRQIGDRIEAIRRWENWEERSRWKGDQDRANDKFESGKGTEAKKNKEEEDMNATREELASVDRKPVDTDEVTAVEENLVAAMEADEDRKFFGELEASERTWKAARKQKAAEERTASEVVVNEDGNDVGEDEEKAAEKMHLDGEKRASDELEAAEGRRDVRVWEDEEERKLEEEKEAEEERRAAEERDAEEALMVAKEREAEREGIAAHEKEADQRKIGEIREAQVNRTVTEQREAGREEKREAEKSPEDTWVANESRNDVEQTDVKQTDLKEKTYSVVEEKKSPSDQTEDERTVKLEGPTEEGKHTKDQIQGNDNEEKHEEKHEDSDQNYIEDLSILSGQTQPTSLAAGECDLFDGDWEYDPEGPLYTNSTCFFIRGDHNCMSNGRPDTDYLNWRWKPRGCDLPRFDGRAFMEAFRGKTIGFIGDSLARNQMQSMLCMLSLVEVPIHLHENFTITRWLFEQHQVTLTVAWSPYLLKESREGVMGFEEGQSVLFMDVLDPVWTSMLPDCDLIVLSVGQWYFKPSVYVMEEKVIGCHYCPNLNLTKISFLEQYGRGLRRAMEKVAEDWKGIAILSTFASAHGERGPADKGDQCRREKPIDKKEWGSSFRGMQMEMREVVVGEFNGMVNDKSKLNKDVHLEFLDVSTLSLLRPDGHPGPYYLANPYRGKNPDEWVFNDCLHWCLPGPVDTWNQLLVNIAHKYV